MKFQEDFSPFHVDFRHRYVQVFELNSMQDAAGNRFYTELVAEPLRLELVFTFPLKHATKPMVLQLRERMSLIALDNFGVPGKEL